MSINYHKMYRRLKRGIASICSSLNNHIIVFGEAFDSRKYRRSDILLSGNVYLYYWKISDVISDYPSNIENIGDYLSLIIVKNLMPEACRSGNTGNRNVTISAVGSLLGLRRQNAVIWGSGILYPTDIRLLRIKKSKLDIRAVRGPETRKELIRLGKKCPEIYGDPAVLMPLFYLPPTTEKAYRTTIIFNYADRDRSVPREEEGNVLSALTKDYRTFIDRIVRSELVISSSLHGIILAEAYGVPAILLRQEGQELYKFKDWYYSTGRTQIEYAESVQQALNMTPMSLPDLTKIQEGLLKSFPRDIWQ